MDLKIQHSCSLTTSQLKGSGFAFLQSDPHCALRCSTAAATPTRRGSAEAVMTLHFLRCRLSCLWQGRNMDSRPAVRVGRGNTLGLLVRYTIGLMLYLNLVRRGCAPSGLSWVTEKVYQHLPLFLQTFTLSITLRQLSIILTILTEKKLKLESFDDPPPNSQ